jgi:hypothetical protein
MELLECFLEVANGHVRVDLRGLDVLVAEEHLNGENVGGVIVQVCSKAVAEHVWI